MSERFGVGRGRGARDGLTLDRVGIGIYLASDAGTAAERVDITRFQVRRLGTGLL